MKGFTNRGGGEIAKIPCGTIQTQLTFEGRLREEKTELEKRLANINAVLGQLEKNPEMAKFVEALNRLGY